ncbi:hypothetical protein BC943DRAFT_360939 [Umbelopsis sp. AD052]|nr:hypothetical protein BC943DRAFT_360939 [Umbelopsis sp. AD052]
MSSSVNDQRVIIQTDIDFFYGQVEELENPALKGQPFGVQQKHIIVTCNYIARGKGVRKLQLLGDALKACPELAIVNGEDLARYRVASKGIFHLVRSLVTGQKVERLGLDELFIDVTDMMEAHLTELGWNGDPDSTTVLDQVQTFRIPSNGQSFTYNPYNWIGFKIDNDGDRMSQSSQSQERLSWRTIKYHAASHLAAFIRNQIKERLGFTCSAGIATSKIFSKLAADIHKPNEQTLLCPDKYADFLEPLHIRKIMGIGYKASRTLCKKLGLMKDENQANEEDTLDDVDEAAQEGEAWYLPELTVSYVQQHCTLQQFLEWFGDRHGPVLWDLIHGIDTAQVIPTPLIPSQISIEDSFRVCKTMADATSRLHDLAIDFIKRLEVELRVKDEFVKYPTTLRLTTRNRGLNEDGTWRDSKGVRDTRISKSSRMPVDVFDPSRSIAERASALVEQSLLPMLRHLVKEPFALTLLNIAAAHLSTKRPAISIQNLFAKGKSALEHLPLRPDDIDESTWSDLPLDIQREIAQHHRSPTHDHDNIPKIEETSFTSTTINTGPPTTTPPLPLLKRKRSNEEVYYDDDTGFAPSDYESMVLLGDGDETWDTCSICGKAMFTWGMQAHRLYHEKEARNQD